MAAGLSFFGLGPKRRGAPHSKATGWVLAAGLGLAAVAVSAEPSPPLRPQAPAAVEGQSAIYILGNREFSTDELLAAIEQQRELIATHGASAALADDCAFFIELYYHERGFADATARYRVQGSTIVLTIAEGPRYEVGNLRLGGNRSFPEKVLVPYVLAPTHRRTTILNATPFVEAEIEQGTEELRDYYVSEGFPNMEVREILYNRSPPPQSKVDILVRIEEGPQFHHGVPTFSGQTGLHPARLADALGDLAAGPYSEYRRRQIERRLEAFYKEQGYFAPEVTTMASLAPHPAAGKATIHVHVDSGERYTFGNIVVSGVTHLPPDFVHNRLRSLQGKRYSPERLDEEYRSLMRTGLFSEVRIDPEPARGGLLNLDVSVTEAKPREIGFGLGFDTYDGPFGSVEYLDRSIFDTGRRFGAEGLISLRGFAGRLTLTEPWLFESDFSLESSVFIQRTDYDIYLRRDIGVRLELAREINDDLKVSGFLQAKQVTIEESEVRPAFLGPDAYEVATVGLKAIYDTRDVAVIPASGIFLALEAEEALPVFSTQYFRFRLRGAYYIPIEKHTLILRAQGGVITAIAEEPLPIDERFFNGGANTVRSFNERELGPTDSAGHHIGGLTYTAFTVEWDFPIAGDLHGAVFFDAGNLTPAVGGLPGQGDMRYGVGAGLRYYLPIGPIRFDAALNPDRRDGEPSGAVHFGFGFFF